MMKKLFKCIFLLIIGIIFFPITVNAECVVNTDLTSITIDFNEDGTKVTKVTFDYAFYDMGLNSDNDYYYNLNITDADITNVSTAWREGVNTWGFTTSQIPATALNLNSDSSKNHKGFMAVNQVTIDPKYTGGIAGRKGTLVTGSIILNDSNVLNQLDLNKDYYIALMSKVYAYQYPSIKYNYRFGGSFYTGVHTKVNLSKYKHKVIIRFDGTEQEIEIEHNSTIGDIDEPLKDGYVFDSWYYDEELTNKANDTDLITGNTSLYPKFEKLYTISYNINGHGNTPTSEQVVKNAKVTEPDNITAEGYIFKGWYKDEDLTEQWDFDNDVVLNNTILYAKWEKEEYTVKFELNGYGQAISDQTIEYSDKVNKPTNPTNEGYIFKGWYKDEDLTEQWDFDNDVVLNNTMLYAKWEKDYTYKIISGDNQEKDKDNIDSYVLKIDGDYTLFNLFKIGELELVKNVDYMVTEEDTTITLTEAGILKLSKLAAGSYDITAEFTNNTVTGKLEIKDNNIANPKTGDNIIVTITVFIITILGAYSILKINKKLTMKKQ